MIQVLCMFDSLHKVCRRHLHNANNLLSLSNSHFSFAIYSTIESPTAFFFFLKFTKCLSQGRKEGQNKQVAEDPYKRQ